MVAVNTRGVRIISEFEYYAHHVLQHYEESFQRIEIVIMTALPLPSIHHVQYYICREFVCLPEREREALAAAMSKLEHEKRKARFGEEKGDLMSDDVNGRL